MASVSIISNRVKILTINVDNIYVKIKGNSQQDEVYVDVVTFLKEIYKQVSMDV